jgi:hypothetical protein
VLFQPRAVPKGGSGLLGLTGKSMRGREIQTRRDGQVLVIYLFLADYNKTTITNKMRRATIDCLMYKLI